MDDLTILGLGLFQLPGILLRPKVIINKYSHFCLQFQYLTTYKRAKKVIELFHYTNINLEELPPSCFKMQLHCWFKYMFTTPLEENNCHKYIKENIYIYILRKKKDYCTVLSHNNGPLSIKIFTICLGGTLPVYFYTLHSTCVASTKLWKKIFTVVAFIKYSKGSIIFVSVCKQYSFTILIF